MQTKLGTQHGSGLPRLTRRFVALVALGALFFSLACWKKNQNTANTSSNNSTGNKSRRVTNQKYLASLPQGFQLPDDADEVGQRVLADYGSVFVARGSVQAPTTVIFADEAATQSWQSSVKTRRESFGGIELELQTPAMTALMEARSEAQKEKLDITSRGADAARRSYSETVKLWESRVNPGLTHWTRENRLSKEEAERIRRLSPREQVPEILRLEADGLYFSTDFKKSILYSVAAPGTSQHLSMLAFDVQQHDTPEVRQTLARHGWFQTISSDLPHFTYLGVTEDQLPSLGLKKKTSGGRTFWIPQLTE
jgi:hypothetical protein